MKRKMVAMMAVFLSLSLVTGGCSKKEESVPEVKSQSSEAEKKPDEVTDKRCTVAFQDKSYKGTYTGETNSKKVPNGSGTFTYEKDSDGIYLTYEGEFEKGEIKGDGTMDTNNYLIVFSSADPESENVERIGTYKGPVKDGKAEGEGVYTAVNGDGNKYTYTGEFKNGTFNGQGERAFEDASLNIVPEKGNFVDGNFYPTIPEAFVYIGRDRDPDHANGEFDVNENEKKALEAVEKSDDPAAYVESHVDAALTYDDYVGNPDGYAGKVVSWTYKVQSLGIYAYNYWQENYGLIIVYGFDENNKWTEAHILTEPDKAESQGSKIAPDSSVTVTGIPLGTTTFDAVNEAGDYTGENVPEVVLAGFKYVIN